ncbi:uncharacterized protein TRAVEDRAFT_51104 [Trametes versicolor FP-101664 SS1]|uniref:uncharacterized protein n=1 Tax=Trametes versicolor (strain FP-101664) TaxID=717944 RepID=UPI0004621A78|nr:uncharacterized protein TRAVEDRAFT_51104 [Trametes versicolor FP-101664 SS1]EIW54976.1 hypothetical protein TRAVEDRAFT_51104 [Trametes versicolor FP-101664 SS1]
MLICCTSVSCADDVGSLLYTLLQFYRTLSSLVAEGTLDALLAHSPSEFADYHAHVVGLAYGQEPDYALLRGLVRDRMVREGWLRSWVYDWMNPSMLPKATLLYEASTVILDYVEDNEYDAHLM